MEEISLYVHIPFCTKKCPYCHFFVLPDKEALKRPFVNALYQELALRGPQLHGKRLVSIYFGGGTPTRLSPDIYASLLEKIRASGAFIEPDCEITLEANPDDVSLPTMQAYRSAGINRISLGVQSLIDTELTLLGRGHGAPKALQAIETIANAGLSNLSIDLLFELPSQTLASFEATLAHIPSLPITHLSLYNLTFEPHTPFFKQRQKLSPLLPADPERLQMLHRAVQALEASGLMRYEISAFARPGKESQHNSGYWTARPFLGLGPSAFSYWEGSRFSNTTPFTAYLEQIQQGKLPIGFTETLSAEARFKELFAVQLRLCKGVEWAPFCARWGTPSSDWLAVLETLITRGWITWKEGTLRLTSEGQLFYDTVATELI